MPHVFLKVDPEGRWTWEGLGIGELKPDQTVYRSRHKVLKAVREFLNRPFDYQVVGTGRYTN